MLVVQSLMDDNICPHTQHRMMLDPHLSHGQDLLYMMLLKHGHWQLA